jgi:hypothetical protein
MLQIDFRDHANFSAPLEYLLYSAAEYKGVFDASHAQRGNRLRKADFERSFVAAGFKVLSFTGNMDVDPEYWASFLPRLAASPGGRELGDRVRDIPPLSGEFHIAKSSGKSE